MLLFISYLSISIRQKMSLVFVPIFSKKNILVYLTNHLLSAISIDTISNRANFIITRDLILIN